MTREDAKDKMLTESVQYKNGLRTVALRKINNFIDKIFDEHEAQLKAKESDLERQDMIIKCLSMDLDSKEKLLKAKDEEIKVLECRAYHAEGYISDLHNNPKDKKFYDKKARSIVAMLFWEWRKAETRYQEEWKTKRDNRQLSLLSISSYKAEVLFKQAYKMLKDNKCYSLCCAIIFYFY